MASPQTAKPAAHSLNDQIDKDLEKMLDTTPPVTRHSPQPHRRPPRKKDPWNGYSRMANGGQFVRVKAHSLSFRHSFPPSKAGWSQSLKNSLPRPKEEVPATYGWEQIGSGGQQKRV